jgi:hypothetical protein
LKFFQIEFLPLQNLVANITQNYWCASLFWSMRPPLIYPQLPYFHIHGVATFIPSKENLKFIFLLKYFQNLLVIPKIKRRSSKTREKKRKIKGIENKEERERKELQNSIMIKG